MKILLFGKNGQLGQTLTRDVPALGETIALDRQGGGDLNDLEALASTIRRLRPTHIVNAAAYTAVDKAESEYGQALRINAEAPGVMAREAQALGAWLVHYSTDYVFDGSGHQAWRESDATGPLNVYGQTKLEGEQRVQAGCQRHLIFRTSWVYAADGQNFAKTMLRLAQERQRLTVINDQCGAPTGAELITRVTLQALQQALSPGVYHLAASGQTTWHAYASQVIAQAKALRPDLPWQVQDIAPVPSSVFATAARRPLNSRLDCSKLQQALGIELPGWQVGVDALLAQILKPSSFSPT